MKQLEVDHDSMIFNLPAKMIERMIDFIEPGMDVKK